MILVTMLGSFAWFLLEESFYRIAFPEKPNIPTSIPIAMFGIGACSRRTNIEMSKNAFQDNAVFLGLVIHYYLCSAKGGWFTFLVH